jgi:hypothetical protein
MNGGVQQREEEIMWNMNVIVGFLVMTGITIFAYFYVIMSII